MFPALSGILRTQVLSQKHREVVLPNRLCFTWRWLQCHPDPLSQDGLTNAVEVIAPTINIDGLIMGKNSPVGDDSHHADTNRPEPSECHKLFFKDPVQSHLHKALCLQDCLA